MNEPEHILLLKRTLICFILCVALFIVSIMRVTSISLTDYGQLQTARNGINLNVGISRGTIYDCNNVPLTNNEEKIIAAVSPTPRAITAIKKVLKENELDRVLLQLKKNKPVLCEVPEIIECDGIVCTKTTETSNPTALHLLGYTNSDGKGVSGIEKAYNDILYCDENVSIYYETDGKGRILEGIEPVITNENRSASHGVVTTIDINIQSIAEEAANNLKKGAVIVAEAKSGKIRAGVSRPTFEPDNIREYLNSADSPLLNRIINNYNVGSVFKPCVAAAGLDTENVDFHYTCTGSCEIIDRYFKCHKLTGHGNLNLRTALANSCNTYFYNFAFNVGYETIYKTAQKFSFNQKIKLCNGIYSQKGNLPEKQQLSNIAHLANFSIGQGELLLSPVAMLNLYCAIANNGNYYIPSLVEGVYENGKYTKYDNGKPTHAIKEDTANTLKEYLKSVLSEGTGENATPKTVSAAGKTATAQTGKFENGKEICQGWFCGFFPADNPQYVVIVFSEDDSKQLLSCGEIFALIADKINRLKKLE